MRAICLYGLLTTLCFTSAMGAQTPDQIADQIKKQEFLATLPQVTRFDLEVDYPSRLLKLVSVSPKDDQLTKLKKQKLIAALKSLQARYEDVRVGKAAPTSDFTLCTRLVKEATIDLNDGDLTKKLVDDYVRLLERFHAVAESRFNSGIKDGGTAAEYYPVLYAYLDAQIWQLSLKKRE